MEIDFLIAKSKISNRHNISPIEVKSSKNYTISSLQKFKAKYDEQLHVPYVLHRGSEGRGWDFVFAGVYDDVIINIIVSRNLFYGDRLSNSKEQASNPPALYYYLPSNIFRYIFSTLNFGASSSTT